MTETVSGLPSLLSVGMRVALVPPALKGDRWHTVLACGDEGGSGMLVALSGVSDISAAQALVGKTVLAAVDDLPEGYELHDVEALLGRAVVDADLGLAGIIEEILVGPANDVWVVRLTDGERAYEYLLPVIDEVVDAASPTGTIEVHIPAGLEPSWSEPLDATVSDMG